MIILFEDINENKKDEAPKISSSNSPPRDNEQLRQNIQASDRMFASLRMQLASIFRKVSGDSLKDMGIKE